MAKTITVNVQENDGLGAAVNLYRMFLANDVEEGTIESIADKFIAQIKTLPDGDLPDDQTISVDLEDNEAALCVKAIDLVTGRDESMERVREQLGGGETTPEPERATQAPASILDLLLGGLSA